MQYKTILRSLGLLLLVFCPSMLTPLIINAIYQESLWMPFTLSFMITLSAGSALWFCFNQHQSELKIREGFLIVVLFWVVLCFFAALPFLLTITHPHGITDAIFETVSGLTTTGASAFQQLDGIPHTLLYYRQQLQFLGGIGIIVLAVAILPMLGVGGMQLYRTEIPGPVKDTKLTPRIAQTAKALWSIYVCLTLLCALCYWLLGMDWFDALGESFGTVSTGGFSLHSTSFGYYKQDGIKLVASLFMLLGGINFSLHFIAFKKRSLTGYWLDEECRGYLLLLLSVTCIIILVLLKQNWSDLTWHTVIVSLFTVISYATTTGFDTEPISSWPTFVPLMILFLMIIGGCAASTSGGVKVVRALLLFKQSKRELKRLLHPQAILSIKFGRQILPEPILQSMWGFISAFIALYLLLMLIFMALGHDLAISFSMVTAGLANAGAGVGHFNVTFAALDSPSKWLMIFSMLAGRLEIFSILILLTREFWEK